MESSRGGGWTRWILRRWISSRNRRPHPVLNRDYATRIARDWNVKHSGSGYVTRFDVRREFLDRYPVQQAGGRTILEYWIPAEDLPDFNANIVGLIEAVEQFHAKADGA